MNRDLIYQINIFELGDLERNLQIYIEFGNQTYNEKCEHSYFSKYYNAIFIIVMIVIHKSNA